MKKNILLFDSLSLGISFLLAACNVPVSSATQPALVQNTALPTEAIQFTPLPTFTLEVQPTAPEPTVTPIPVSPAKLNEIKFPVNGTYADVTDVIPAGSKTYTLNAMKGQIMSISVLPQVPDGDWGYLSIQIRGADGSMLCPKAPDTECLFWRGVLPLSQDYFITLTPNGNVPKFILRVAINPPGKDVQYFQYHNPSSGISLTYPDSFAPAVPVYGNYKTAPEFTLHLIDSKTYEKTNLGEVYLFVSSTSDPLVVATCTDSNPNGGEFEQIVGNQIINGYTFVHSTSNGAGAGNRYDQEIYRMAQGGTCYEVIYFMHSANIGNFPAGEVTEFNRDALIQRFLDVFATFIIK